MSFSQDEDKEQKTVAGFIVGGAVALAVAVSLFFGLNKAGVIGKKHTGYTAAKASASGAASAAAKGVAASGAAQAASGNVAATGAASAAMGAASTADAGKAADAASVQVVNGVVRFYFASGKSDVAAGAKDAIKDAVAAAKAGKKLVISGYHDSTGSAERNAELAKERALKVKAALEQAGVAAASIELKKPEVLANSKGNDPEARRVEVAIK